MPLKKRDIESAADSLGINLNSHLNFGIIKPSNVLTSIIDHQASPAEVVDNVEKKG